MQGDNTTAQNTVYSKNVIEFVTVVAETCLFLERVEGLSRNEFLLQAIKLLPLLYFKAVAVEMPEPIYDDPAERFVTEEDYLFVREKIEQLLGNDNVYLEVFHPDMKFSDTPIAVLISEDMADIYQEIKDFASNYSLGMPEIMNDALIECLETFREHWGQKLLNCLRALHALRYNEDFDSYNDEEDEQPNQPVNRNSFLDYLRETE